MLACELYILSFKSFLNNVCNNSKKLKLITMTTIYTIKVHKHTQHNYLLQLQFKHRIRQIWPTTENFFNKN